MDENRITYFAEADYRNQSTRFGIKAIDRTRHVYVIGKTGMGKSTVLENMAIQDIQNGEGIAFIDPHGGTAEKLLDYVPEDRVKDVIYFAPFDTNYPISFNIMEDVGADKRHLVASGLMSAFKKIWADAWSARMEYILNNTILALLEYPDATLLGVNRMLSDKEYRKKVIENIADPSVKSFWVDEFAKYTERFAAEATPAIQNKVGQFTSNPLIRNIIGQPKSSFDIRKIMDEKKILIMNLSKGLVGEQNAKLLGSMLVTKIYLAAMSRADLSSSELKTKANFFNFYIDEFQTFANETFAEILSEARKYKLNLNIAHQYVEQMPEEVRAAVFGNVGTMIVFRVGSFDAEIFEKEFAPQFTADDIVNLGQYQMYLRLMIDGVGSKPFSARGMAPIAAPARSYKEEIIAESRARNAKTRLEVEESISKWHEPIIDEKKAERMKKYADGQVAAPGTTPPTTAAPATSPQSYATAPRTEYSPSSSSRPQFENRPPNTGSRTYSTGTPVASYPKPSPTVRPQTTSVAQPVRPVTARHEAPSIPRVQPPPVVRSNPMQSSPPAQSVRQPMKQSLGELLSKLDTESPKQNEQNDEKEKPAAREEPKVEPVSLTSLRPKDEKGPTPNKLSMLKNVLEKLNKDAQEKKTSASTVASKEQPKHTEPMPPLSTAAVKASEPTTQTSSRREVPEEVLRRILE